MSGEVVSPEQIKLDQVKEQEMKSKLASLCGLVMLAFCTAGFAKAGALFFGPSPYLAFDNALPGAGPAISPFSGLGFSYFYLETFEDGVLNTLGVSADHGFVGCCSIYEDSVDADDGVIDGNGNGGHSWGSYDNSVSFTFNESGLGRLPTHVGVVWTDVGNSPNPNYDYATFTAFDASGSSLGQIRAFVGDGGSFGQTAEDRFFGVANMDGVSRITLTMDIGRSWELDHLQYGAAAAGAVPEPATILLVGLSIALVAAMKLRGKRQ